MVTSNVIDHVTALRADVYVAGDDPLHAWAFARRQRLVVGALSIWVAPVEYVIIRKLQYYMTSGSDRHLRDVAMMLRISANAVNADELQPWVAALGLSPALDSARRFVG